MAPSKGHELFIHGRRCSNLPCCGVYALSLYTQKSPQDIYEFYQFKYNKRKSWRGRMCLTHLQEILDRHDIKFKNIDLPTRGRTFKYWNVNRFFKEKALAGRVYLLSITDHYVTLCNGVLEDQCSKREVCHSQFKQTRIRSVWEITAPHLLKTHQPAKEKPIMAKTNLMEASQQWMSRPPDERFWDLAGMLKATKATDEQRTEFILEDPAALRCSWNEKQKQLAFDIDEQEFNVQHWAFRLLCARVKAPARFIQDLPGPMAAELLNYRLQTLPLATRTRLSIRNDFQTPRIEAVTSSRYGYIPNFKLVQSLQKLEKLGWRIPPARPNGHSSMDVRKATKKDVLQGKKSGLSIKEGDEIAPAGLYASDHDMFAFMVNEKRSPIEVKGFNLSRGIFLYNSEVGAGKMKLVTFLYDAVCGNHIVWGARDIVEIGVRHIGAAETRAALQFENLKLANGDNKKLSSMITAAMRFKLGKDRDEVVEAIYSNRRANLSKVDAGKAFDFAEENDADRTDPRSLWGFVCGLTRLSQETPFADERMRYDQSAANLVSLLN